MSLIPEFILQTMITRGIKTIRRDSRFVDQLFRNLDQKAQAQIRDFIKTQAIDLCMNYPRDQLKIPAIIILLKSENEFQAFLGDSMGVDLPDELGYDGGLSDEILGGTATAAALSGQGRIAFGPYRVLSATANTLTIDSSEWVTSQYLEKSYTVHIVGGTGRGQKRTITANSRTVLMVSTNWSTALDTTSVFEIRGPADEVVRAA